MLFTSTSVKTMFFVSLVMLSNAALPPNVQQEFEEKRIRNSPHMNEMIGKGRKFGITNIEAVPSEIAQIDGYEILTQYKVTANTRGDGNWMTAQGFITKDFTVYSVKSKNPSKIIGPINFGLLFEDGYVEDPQAGQSGYPNASGVLPLPLGPGPVIIRDMVKLDKNRKEQCLPTDSTVGYFIEHQMVGTYQARGLVGNDVLPYRSHDKSVVTCKLVDITPKGFCGGRIYRQEFKAHKYGRTTVTNGPVTYTIQVGLLK